MRNVLDIVDASTYGTLCGAKAGHSLASIVDFQKLERRVYQSATYRFGVYAIYLQEVRCGDLQYGNSLCNFHEGALLFFAPNQLLHIEASAMPPEPRGQVMFFHPTLIHGSPLGRNMHAYPFFPYRTHEALHLSDSERQIVRDCFQRVDYETQRPFDRHSKGIICASIELFLDYCLRFYDRQFTLPASPIEGIATRFEALLNDYFHSDEPLTRGFPQVNFFAGKLNLSRNYLSDLMRMETGISPQKYIQDKIIDLAKERIATPGKPITEISRELGFAYPQHFTRFFKQRTGMTPTAYRAKAKALAK